MDPGRLRELFDVIDAKRWDVFGDFFGADVVYERPGTRDVRGLGDLVRFYRDERRVASSVHHIDGSVVQGDRGAVWGHAECVMADGTATDIGFADVFEFGGGRITLRRSHFFVPAV